MPTYGYRCPKCGREYDVWQRMTDKPHAPCPNCGAVGKRLFFPAGIVFKGSGFYKTDSRSTSTSGSRSGSATSPAKPSTDGGPSSTPSTSSPSSPASAPAPSSGD